MTQSLLYQYTLSVTDNDLTEEQKECFEIIMKFLRTCKSNMKSIELRDFAIPRSLADYNIDDSTKAISFILNEISIIGICKKQQFGYGKNPDAPFIYEYIFEYKDKNGNLGCLAFYKNPDTKKKIKWYIKTLHKDDMSRKPYITTDIFWLPVEQKQLLLGSI